IEPGFCPAAVLRSDSGRGATPSESRESRTQTAQQQVQAAGPAPRPVGVRAPGPWGLCLLQRML
ncbi:hypothetical protein NDU88_006450, partial [Pleurodeles waltl]